MNQQRKNKAEKPIEVVIVKIQRQSVKIERKRKNEKNMVDNTH